MEILLGILGASALVGAGLALRSFYRVEEGHAAVLTSFGRLRTDSSGKPWMAGPGLRGKLPWETVHEFSVMERMVSVREENREVETMARDGTLLRLDPQVRFRFRPDRFEQYVFGLARPSSHLRELFRSLISSEVAQFGEGNAEEGSYSELRRRHPELRTRIANRFAPREFSEKYGIDFVGFDITEILPPADLAQALNSVQKVEAENNTLLHRIRAECEQRIASAEHGVEIAALKAEAAEREIRILGETVAEMEREGQLSSYLQRRRDETAAHSKTLYLKA